MQEIFVAALLHEIGKVGFDDVLMGTPVVMMNTKQREVFRKHPILTMHLLTPMEELKGAAEMIGGQLERFDGGGYPQQLAEQKIPIGSRIIIAACDGDSLPIGVLGQRQLDAREAQAAIVRGSGHQYDLLVVQAMVVSSRDLMASHGLLMLTAGHVLDDAVINKIADWQKTVSTKFTIDIWRDAAV